jgi:hypothetical protein
MRRSSNFLLKRYSIFVSVFRITHAPGCLLAPPVGDEQVPDVAVLELVEDAPADAGTAIFARVHRPMDFDPLVVFGIPAGHQAGNYVETKFMGHTSVTQVEIDGLNASGVFIQGGQRRCGLEYGASGVRRNGPSNAHRR